MRRESAKLLWDARQASALANSFVADIGFKDYVADQRTMSAVERQLEIAGEALSQLKKLDGEVAGKIPDLNRIIGMRNVLAHGYAVVDPSVVWNAAANRVPAVIQVIDEILDSPIDT